MSKLQCMSFKENFRVKYCLAEGYLLYILSTDHTSLFEAKMFRKYDKNKDIGMFLWVFVIKTSQKGFEDVLFNSGQKLPKNPQQYEKNPHHLE